MTVNKLSPQCKRILDVLETGQSLTQRSATIDLSVAALPRRICDLMEAGYAIKKQMQYNVLTGQRFMRYWLG